MPAKRTKSKNQNGRRQSASITRTTSPFMKISRYCLFYLEQHPLHQRMLLPNLILQIPQHGARLAEKPKLFRKPQQKQSDCQKGVQISRQRQEEMSDPFIFSIVKPLPPRLPHHLSPDFTATNTSPGGLAARWAAVSGNRDNFIIDQ
jgi:hypothetical protein